MITLDEIRAAIERLAEKLRIEDYLPERYIDLNERRYYWMFRSPPPMEGHCYREINSEEEAYRLLYELLTRHGMID